ncbi:IclR family transcriptional regulator [Paractinoplanes ferrugineus]|uniref:Transcriptional regulator n=1 Tax=Paractinoplanes ferrugineus TaxID=113564 RepID=A0A919MHL1_9ACTN|nr:transcriptional regulator [Actinoplanes ferrugineus]
MLASPERPTMLSRGIRILNCFDEPGASYALSDIARRTGLPKTTAHRLIGELLDWGMLDRNGSAYSLGRSIAALNARLSEDTAVAYHLLASAQRLPTSLPEPVLLSVFTEQSVTHFDTRRERRVMDNDLALDQPWPACIAAASKIALASWRFRPTEPVLRIPDTARLASAQAWSDADLLRSVQQGYSTCRVGDMVAAAVVIRDATAHACGALSTAVPAEPARRAETIRTLIAAGGSITKA